MIDEQIFVTINVILYNESQKVKKFYKNFSSLWEHARFSNIDCFIPN